MKREKSFYILFLLILFLTLFIYIKKNQRPSYAETLNQKEEVDSTNVEDLAVLSNEESVTDKASQSESNKIKEEESIEEDLAQEKCWSKIFANHKENPDFYNQNKTHLLKYVGPWFYGKEKLTDQTVEAELPGVFMLAMAKAGLILGSDDYIHVNNLPEALDLLDAVMQQDPSNSAPLLMAAYLNKSLYNMDKYKELIERTKFTKRFDTYESAIIQSFYKGIRTPEDLIAAINIRSTHPVIAISSLRKLLIEEKQINIAYQMLDSALDSTHKVTNDDWSESMTYTVADLVLKELGDPSPRKPSGKILAENMKPCHENVMEDYLSEIKSWQNNNEFKR